MRPLVVLVLCGAACLGGTIDDRHPDSRYTEYAKGFAAYTLKLRATTPDGRPMTATAVAVAPRFAMTAAHVAQDIATCSLISGTTTRRVARVFVHPAFRDEDLGQHDLAVLEVAEPFSVDYYPPLADAVPVIGGTVSICGYGLTGRMSTGYTTTDGQLRAGTNTVERIDADVMICTARPGSSPLEYCIAPGCSGGPVFSDGRLVAINSYTSREGKGATVRSRTGEESGHALISPHREWLRAVSAELDAAFSVKAWQP